MGISLKLPLELDWRLKTGERMIGSAAISDGLVFVGSDSGKIIAADVAEHYPIAAARNCLPNQRLSRSQGHAWHLVT